jgi:1,5-anhydro-D-fructose reductase (1,5-anhydro-D-mannitol-forming)
VNSARSTHSREIIRWGIIGCGDVTEIKSGPGFQKAHGSQLVAVMRRNESKAADYARRHGVPRWYSQAELLIGDADVDAVYIATPPGSHLELAQLVAAAGKPCYVEKPMARTAMECKAMVAAFRSAKQPLFVAYYRRAQARFLKVKALIASAAIGEVTSIHYRMATPTPANAHATSGAWRVDAAVAGGGLLLDVGSHVLDLIDFFFGPLEHVHGEAVRQLPEANVEDVVAMTFRTPANALGTASWNFAGHVKEDLFQIVGTAGRISFSVFGSDPVQLETAKGTESFDLPYPPHVAQPLIQTVVDELLGRGTCPSTGESAQRTSAVMDEVLNGYYGGRRDSFWERPETWPGLAKLPGGSLGPESTRRTV